MKWRTAQLWERNGFRSRGGMRQAIRATSNISPCELPIFMIVFIMYG